MKVSIITSCFNRQNTIREAIESVLAQDYPNIEYIIVDGASNDNSLKIINEYKNYINTIISEPDKGMYEAINKGITAATGDIIGLVHSDDFLYDTHVISNIVKKFKQTNADIIYGDGLFVDYNNTDKIIRNWISGSFHRWKVKCGWLPLHPTVYIKRSIINQWGQYDESYKIAADSDFLIRYFYEAHLHIEYLKTYIIKMRMGGLSTNNSKRKLMWKEDVHLYKKHGFCGVLTKLLKMSWKIPQFISAKFQQI
ncbi:glycosyltransferase family 2 protein [Bacteroides stercoris]|jgi:glycosyltransferase involved in cell wall biosynthesis|uniref:glycosyltransferase family 2 protein n=1 Tax=Bacteroides stercoris TaxID=46506 RepID=UPI000E527454|nr:glycosyltransferase family 2 protein [Bacteroides stercoris]RHE48029.1 glycosyltransferase [Bacteroides stercoris]